MRAEQNNTAPDPIVKILDALFWGVIAEGGDGDAVWYTKFLTLEEIAKAITEYNAANYTHWELIVEEDHLSWGENQEWVTITNDLNFYNKQPDWFNLRIIY